MSNEFPNFNEPLALPPGPNLNFMDMVHVGPRYHYGPTGSLIADEYIYKKAGVETIHFSTRDALGNDTSVMTESNAFNIEGKAYDGYLRTVVERSPTLLPKRAVGVEVRESNESEIMSRILLDQQEPDSEEFEEPTGYWEATFDYTDDGLLACVTEFYQHNQFETEKERHQLFYSEDGEAIGVIKSKLVDVSAQGVEEYQISNLTTWERGEDRWRATQYMSYRDGLVPLAIEEGPADQPKDATYFIDSRANNDLLAYQVAHHPDYTTLNLFKNILESAPRHAPEKAIPHTIQLPSFIPIEAAQSLASGHLTHEAAATIPNWPELAADIKIATLPEAIEETIDLVFQNSKTNELCELIRDIADRRFVVMHRGDPDEYASHTEELAKLSIAFQDVDRLAVIAIMHPAFGRTDLIPYESLQSVYDMHLVELFLMGLQTSRETMRDELERRRPQLNETAVRAFTYLLSQQAI